MILELNYRKRAVTMSARVLRRLRCAHGPVTLDSCQSASCQPATRML